MSRIEDEISAIAARARAETSPRVDVTAAVLRRLRATQVAADRPLYWLAAGALAAAAIVMFISMPYLNGAFDPLTEFLAEADTSII